MISLTLIKVLLSLLNCFLSIFYRKKFRYQKGTWAIVTACTDGLGLGFTEELAKRGLNIIQVGRNPLKLTKQGVYLKETYNIQVRSIIKDFEHSSKDPISFFSEIFTKTADLDITILVNNVGGGQVKQFIHSDKVLYTLALNVFPMVFLTKMFLNMEKRVEKLGIINVSSVTSLFPGTRLVTYRACKSFNFVFSDVLSSENEVFYMNSKCSIDTICITPGLIDTPSTSYLKSKPLVITKNECADSSLDLLGSLRYNSGHWKHQITYILHLFIQIIEPIIGDSISKSFEEDNN